MKVCFNTAHPPSASIWEKKSGKKSSLWAMPVKLSDLQADTCKGIQSQNQDLAQF